ncbi:hypothetical protein LZ30DRAFT_709654 [Colletotrichum cereale]|nr:hypothetical protein LZ30DRAFT_709654 [Colletotrichum cereale]
MYSDLRRPFPGSSVFVPKYLFVFLILAHRVLRAERCGGTQTRRESSKTEHNTNGHLPSFEGKQGERHMVLRQNKNTDDTKPHKGLRNSQPRTAWSVEYMPASWPGRRQRATSRMMAPNREMFLPIE